MESLFCLFTRSKIHGIVQLIMIGPRDGGFGFDGGKKYSDPKNIDTICVQCQAGQHAKCLSKEDDKISCDCEICLLG